ncbi:hypothetical protein CR513_19058, partial [Mucuna pruriens]
MWLQPNSTRTVGLSYEPSSFCVRTWAGSPHLASSFWFFMLCRADKVGWTSLSSQLWCKLMKPFQESYKQFKDHFFWVAVGHTGRNLLFDDSREPLFPLYWSDQPAISVTVDQDHLKGYSVKDIAALKACSSRLATPAVGA